MGLGIGFVGSIISGNIDVKMMMGIGEKAASSSAYVLAYNSNTASDINFAQPITIYINAGYYSNSSVTSSTILPAIINGNGATVQELTAELLTESFAKYATYTGGGAVSIISHTWKFTVPANTLTSTNNYTVSVFFANYYAFGVTAIIL